MHLFAFSFTLLDVPVCSADDSHRIRELLAISDSSGVVTIPPGDYMLDGTQPLALSSNTTIMAHGARFHLPKTLPDKAKLVVFAGQDISHFAWHSGEFLGHVFDPEIRENTWEPNATVNGIEITTTRPGGTHDLLFRDVKANGMAGAVIGVHGLAEQGSESAVSAWAERVSVENCTLLRSGRFMWDYGYLWQLVTWPEEYEPWEVERARRYFRNDRLRESISMKAGDDRVCFDNRENSLPVSKSDQPSEALTLLGANLPKNVMRGKQYFVVESTSDAIKISDRRDGAPIVFEGDSGTGAALAHNIQATYLAAYAPTGGGKGKGAFDITSAKDLRVTGCMLSAIGDTMHIQRSRNIVFANNQILGSRMGAFFLAEFCQNATITGNIVDGTNGSRVVSVEKSCTDVTMTGNTFRNGGRGAWINQPVNFIMVGNLFINNTTKNEPDMRRGRIAYQTAKPGQFPELYFTLYEPGASYGPVIVRDNIFVLGASAPEEVVTLAANGQNIQFTGNILQGKPAKIVVDPTCTMTRIENNPGAETVTKPVDFNHGRR
ncbi:MAG: right-handed parallel beta-helix repeat-containing protein [Pirellulaceae bacterium]|nr:right-handed parallel beta-helix repeat-containing protein [Pirellulaceae bacterium]